MHSHGVAEIGESAFYHCTALNSILIPHSVTKIEDSAFCGCKALKSINISGVMSIGFWVFSGCTALESMFVSEKLLRKYGYASLNMDIDS